MATLNFESSQDRDRFIRLTRLLIAGGTPILRGILKQYHTPTTLAGALGGTRVGFTKPQKELVFPPSGLLPDFDKFDISLIFKLLRNCCGLTEPTTKWNGFPAESDISLEADIVRIDFCRNEIYGHALEHMALTQQEFDEYWGIISDTLCRRAIDLHISIIELLDKIRELKSATLTSDDHCEFFRQIESILVEQGKKLDKIESKGDQIKEGIEGLQDTMINALQITKIPDDKTPTAAAPSVQYNFTINQFSPNYSSGRAQIPQPFEPQGIRRQVSDSTISHSSPQRPYKKSYSLPSKVGLRTPSSQPQVDRFFSQFQNPQTPDEHQQVSNHLWQNPNQTPATFAPHRESNSAQFYAGQEISPARFSHERSGNPEGLSFQFPNPRGDAEYQVPRHGRQSLNPTAATFAPRRESNGALFYVGQDGPPDPLADQAAAPRTWTSPSHHSFYHATSKDRQASPVNPRLVGRNEWLRHQQQQQLHQDPLLRINISVSGAGLSGFHLSKVVKSVLDTSDEGTDASQFSSYLKKHQLVIKKIEGNGDSCCIRVLPGDLESLEDLWRDFIYQDLREFVKETVLPEDFTGEVDVDMDGEDYKRCCESLRPRGFKDSGRQLHSQSLSQVGLAFNDVREPATETIRTRSQSVMDLPSSVTDASQELFQLICKNGGRMDWQTAKDRLSYSSYIELTKPAFKQNRQFEFLPNNFVQVKFSLKFCPKMRKDSTCNNALCPDLHLCRFYFLEGGCKFPMNCKNSHDISDHHTNNVFKMANLSFLNNEERKQLLHNLAYVVPEICTYYNGISKRFRSCTKGYDCPYLHVCEGWVRGRTCVAGITCQRAHTFTNQHEQDILKKRNLDQLSEKKVLEKLNEHYSYY